MSGLARPTDSSTTTDITLASADPALLLCWEGKVKQGEECSLVLQFKGGKVVTTLTCKSTKKLEAKKSSPELLLPTPVESKKRKSRKPNMKKLLKYHQRLVNEKGLPPSKLMLKHANNEQLMCEICGYIFKSESDLNMHMKTDHFPRIKCDQCQFNCLYINGFKNHKKKNHIIKCGICKIGFETQSKLITHMNLVHEEMKKSFKVRGEELIQKYITKISNGKTPKCPMCKVTFMYLEDLNDHMEMFCTDCKSCVKSSYPKSDWPLPDGEDCVSHQ